jgi:hypothetical protein
MLRVSLLAERPIVEVADRFGYSTASVHQMATLAAGRAWRPVCRQLVRGN